MSSNPIDNKVVIDVVKAVIEKVDPKFFDFGENNMTGTSEEKTVALAKLHALYVRTLAIALLEDENNNSSAQSSDGICV